MTRPTVAAPGVDEEATILVVDDERGLADLYGVWLRDCHDVRTVYSGESALDALDEQVDVVLLDREIPDVSGDDVLDAIRDRGLECRVAMVTAAEPGFDVVDLGFDAYLRKPVDRETLRETVTQLLRRSTYDATVRQYFAAAQKRALLLEEGPAGVTDSPEFDRLTAEIDELRDRLDGVLADFDDVDYDVLFARLSAPSHDTDGA